LIKFNGYSDSNISGSFIVVVVVIIVLYCLMMSCWNLYLYLYWLLFNG